MSDKMSLSNVLSISLHLSGLNTFPAMLNNLSNSINNPGTLRFAIILFKSA